MDSRDDPTSKLAHPAASDEARWQRLTIYIYVSVPAGTCVHMLA